VTLTPSCPLIIAVVTVVDTFALIARHGVRAALQRAAELS
jgi:hypothetical protein